VKVDGRQRDARVSRDNTETVEKEAEAEEEVKGVAIDSVAKGKKAKSVKLG
jgi:hypothetical protein